MNLFFLWVGQWFRISCCLKIYFVLVHCVLVAGYTVQQSITVSSILVSRVGSFEEHFL